MPADFLLCLSSQYIQGRQSSHKSMMKERKRKRRRRKAINNANNKKLRRNRVMTWLRTSGFVSPKRHTRAPGVDRCMRRHCHWLRKCKLTPLWRIPWTVQTTTAKNAKVLTRMRNEPMTIMGRNASWYRNCGGKLDRTQKFHKEQPQNLLVLPSRNTPQGIGTEMLRATPGKAQVLNPPECLLKNEWRSCRVYKVLQRWGSVDNLGSSAPSKIKQPAECL